MPSPVGDALWAQRCGGLATHVLRSEMKHKKRGRISAVPFSRLSRGQCDQWPLERPEVLLPPFFLLFLDFLSPASAAAPLEQHPAEEDLLQDAPLPSVEAEAPLEQHPADLDLSQDAPLLRSAVEADPTCRIRGCAFGAAPLEQHPADLDLSQDAFWSPCWRNRSSCWRPWNRFAPSWPFCRQELPWIGQTLSKRRWRMRRGRGTFSLCC